VIFVSRVFQDSFFLWTVSPPSELPVDGSRQFVSIPPTFSPDPRPFEPGQVEGVFPPFSGIVSGRAVTYFDCGLSPLLAGLQVFSASLFVLTFPPADLPALGHFASGPAPLRSPPCYSSISGPGRWFPAGISPAPLLDGDQPPDKVRVDLFAFPRTPTPPRGTAELFFRHRGARLLASLMATSGRPAHALARTAVLDLFASMALGPLPP